jgi:hypothetical protein
LAVLFGLASCDEIFAPTETTFLATSDDSSIKEKVEEASENLQRLNCFLYDDLTFFDLRKLETQQDGGYEVVGTRDFTGTFRTYHVNFCRRFIIDKGEDKDKRTFVYTTSGISQNADRVLLTNGNKASYTETVLKTNDEGSENTHILYVQSGGDECKTNDKGEKVYYQVTTEIFCNADKTGAPEIKLDDSGDNECNPKITFAHATGCPVFQATSIVRWLANNPIVLGILLIFFGCVVTFWGGKFFPYVLATVSGGLTILVLLLIASVLGMFKALDKENKDPSGGQYAAAVFGFLISFAVGIFVGWFLKKMRRVGICLLGTAAGFFGGFLLYTFVFAKWADHVAVLVVITVLCALVGGYLAWRFDRHLIVYLTSAIGAYALIRGISIFAGKFPNEMVLYGQLSSGAYDGLNNEFYAYFFAIVVTAVLGIVFQFKMGYHQHHHEDDYQKA